jgi:glycosyltransferase involved in cell wall biosynthesis
MIYNPSSEECIANPMGRLRKDMRVVVSHPARQANVYYRPRAAEQLGAKVAFLTGLYYRPDRFPYSFVRYLPPARRKRIEIELEKRRIDGLSPENVISLLGPTLEVTFRPRKKLREWYAIHDWLASRWISRKKNQPEGAPTILHCFQGSSRRTLQAARNNQNVVRLLEITQPPLPLLPECAVYAELQAATLAAEVKEAEFLLVQSEYSARAVEALGVSKDRIVRCHLGVDTSHFRPRTSERKPGPVRVLFLGGPLYRKGIRHLEQAWRELRLEGAELLLSGNVQGRRIELDGVREALPNCRFLGRVPDSQFVELLQDADILVHPSLAEGGCNVVYESLACGLPCIVSTNATSAVRSGKEGIIFPAGDIKALKGAIQILCQDQQLRRKMSEAARQRAEALNWDNYLVNLGVIYERLCEYSLSRNREALKGVLAAGF